MIQKRFIKQLQTDSFHNLILATAAITVLLSMVNLIVFITTDTAAIFWLIFFSTLPGMKI